MEPQSQFETKPKLPPKPRKSGMKGPIIAGLVVGVVIASIFWWVVLRKQTSSEVKSQQTETQEQETEYKDTTDQDTSGEVTGETYIVKSGDTLSSIAVKFDIEDWRDLARANNLEEPYSLKVGDELIIPTGETKGESTGEYKEYDEKGEEIP